MNLDKLHYVMLDEQGQPKGSVEKLFFSEELEVAEKILKQLDGISIIQATSILRKCANALQQFTFCSYSSKLHETAPKKCDQGQIQ